MAFGGSVKLTGESEYRKALSQITQNLKEVSSEMKIVTSAYDTNDKSIEATAAKTQILNKQYAEQTKKLDVLKSEYDSMDKAYQDNAKRIDALTRSYNDERAKLDEIGRTVGTTSDAYQKQLKTVNTLASEIRTATSAQEASEKSMSRMRVEINNAQADCNNTAKAIDNLGKETDETAKQAESAASGGFTVFKGMLANLASDAIEGVLRGLKNLGSKFVEIGKQALGSYGEFEQLEGGVKKLFGDETSKTVMENAQNAFSTAGMSANEYMETVTNFSASLIAGLKGDTKEAARLADMAIKDMSDNANTFGTDISSIQNAYQGFAKQNFTMLDNLKLGYGGTATEMARLINESGVLGDEMTVTAKTVKDVPFAKMIEAINVTQKRLNIMGTTAAEASGTLEGSSKAMGAAWKNLLTGIADENADFEGLVSNFSNSLIGMLKNNIPRIKQIIQGMTKLAKSLISDVLPDLIDDLLPLLNEVAQAFLEAAPQIIRSLSEGLLAAIPLLLPTVTQLIVDLCQMVIELLPEIIQAGFQITIGLLNGITEALPDLLAMLPSMIQSICSTLLDNISLIVDAGIDLVLALTDGVLDALPKLLEMIPSIVIQAVDVLLSNIPKIVDAGIKLLTSLTDALPQIIDAICQALPELLIGVIQGLMQNLPLIVEAGVKLFSALVQNVPLIIKELVKALPKIISALVQGFKDAWPQMSAVGLNLIEGLWNGIKNAADWVLGKIKGFMDSIVGGIKKFFGIASPSKLFRDQIGANLALGIGEGFSDEMKDVTKDMQDAMPTSLEVSPSVSGARYGSGYGDIVSAFKEALSEMKIELDDEVAGHFVDETVTRLIYA